jgi:hypothetical protein
MPEHDTFDAYIEPLLISRQPRLCAYIPRLNEFCQWVLTEVDAQANYTDRYASPALETYDRNGSVANRIVANPPYDMQHQEIYRRGAIGLPYTESAPHLLSFAMGFLLSQADISLHCPVTLTGAVAYVLGYHASNDMRDKYLHELTRMDACTAAGGTWVTELHGGSDVGATTTTAVPQAGRFALHGLKWFASNANSGLAIATARPQGAEPGTAGLGLYLVPSHLDDGSSNRYVIRRLKDKLGTKGLPTGEIELLVTALAKYLTAEDAIRASRATLELVGSNGYTSDYPIARIYRDAQVLTVWEGPANIQALELLRRLAPKYAGAVQYEQRVRGIIDQLPDAMSSLRCALDSRLQADIAAIAFVTADEPNSQRYARKLLERLSHSLAFAFMCETAAQSCSNGDDRRLLTATRYFEELEAPRIGAENQQVRRAVLELLED